MQTNSAKRLRPNPDAEPATKATLTTPRTNQINMNVIVFEREPVDAAITQSDEHRVDRTLAPRQILVRHQDYPLDLIRGHATIVRGSDDGHWEFPPLAPVPADISSDINGPGRDSIRAAESVCGYPASAGLAPLESEAG